MHDSGIKKPKNRRETCITGLYSKCLFLEAKAFSRGRGVSS